MSRKNTPPSYTEPGGPNIVEHHSYRLSPFGPALKIQKKKTDVRSVYNLRFCLVFFVYGYRRTGFCPVR